MGDDDLHLQVMIRKMIVALIFLFSLFPSQALATEPGIVSGDFCDSREGPRAAWSAPEKARTRARVRKACQSLDAAPILCAYADAIVVRESFGGAASVRHQLGKNEDGLGPMGLSIHWHRDKWPGDDEDPAFCTPEASFIVAHEIFWRAVERYGADSIADIQDVYAGRFICREVDVWRRIRWLENLPRIGPVIQRWLPRPEKKCFPRRSARSEDAICSRMARRGFNCHARITVDDLGRRIKIGDRRRWALEQAFGNQSIN